MPVAPRVATAQATVAIAASATPPANPWVSTQPTASAPEAGKLASASTPSRDSQDVRHCDRARQARSGRPRCQVDTASPPVTSASATPKPVMPRVRSIGTAPNSPSSASQASSPKPAPEATVKTMIE